MIYIYNHIYIYVCVYIYILCNYIITYMNITYVYTYKSISLHSGVITLHSGVRQLQLVLITMLFWTVGKQIWHRFCMLQHSVQSTLAVKHMFFSCF